MRGIDKLLAPVAGRPLLWHTLRTFDAVTSLDELVVVTSEGNRDAVERLASEASPRARIVLGGRRRRDSVRAGIDALPDCDYVLIHDGARPLATADLISRALAGAVEIGAALCAVPITDTLKRGTEDDLVYGTVSRERLWSAQTPQAFRRELLLRAHAATDIDATDDAALAELIEAPVRLVLGSTKNLKVTTPEDLSLAEALLRATPEATRGES
jgi:2-C-methyl-D-erythritol 4-phosphate cytidylyltransferase